MTDPMSSHRLIFEELRRPLNPWTLDEMLRVDDRGVWISLHPNRRDGWSYALRLEVSDAEDHLQGALLDDTFWIPSDEFDDAAKTPESTPALPFPFTPNELAAFMLAGWGARLRLFYLDGALASTADDKWLQDLRKRWNQCHGRRGAAARNVLVEAYLALCRVVSVVGPVPASSLPKDLSEGQRHRQAAEQQEAYAKWRNDVVLKLLRPAAEPSTVHTPSPAVIQHQIGTGRKRRHLLTSVLERAQAAADEKFDAQQVLVQLQKLAADKVPPLLGSTEDGVQYLKDGMPESYSRKAVRAWVGRTKKSR